MKKLDDGWWFTDCNGINYGPYSTKESAEEDMRGITRFYKANPEYIDVRDE